jgi:hypothetical protein
MPAGLLLTAPLVDCRRCTSTSVPKISSFRWKRSATVRALLTGLAGGHVPLSHDGLDAAGQSRQVSHLRSLLEHNGPLPQRDEPLARFQTWLGCNSTRPGNQPFEPPSDSSPPGITRVVSQPIQGDSDVPVSPFLTCSKLFQGPGGRTPSEPARPGGYAEIEYVALPGMTAYPYNGVRQVFSCAIEMPIYWLLS